MIKSLLPIFLVLLLAVGCIPIVPSAPAPPNAPPIATIDSLSATTITVGQTITFVGNGTDVGGTVVAYSWRSDKDGILSTSPGFSTSTLSAGTHYIYFKVQDNSGAWSNEPYRIVNVLPEGIIKPFVKSFKAVPAVILEGESITLVWDVSDALTVTISPDIGNVPASGNRLLSPKITTYYILTATNKAGAVTEEVKVTVTSASAKTVELFSIAAEEGYVSSNRDVGTEPKAGVSKSGVSMQAFFSFDISMIPHGSTIILASLDITPYIVYGVPFTFLGAMGVFDHQYGVLESRDYMSVFSKDTLFYTYTQPIRPLTSEQLANAIQKQVDAKSTRFQSRVQFEKFYFQWDANDANYLDFVKGKSKLVIHYK